MHTIQQEIEARAVIRGGLRLLRADDALEILRLCQESDTRLLGVDAIRAAPSYTQPIMELSRDFSMLPVSQAEAVAEVRRLIAESRSTEDILYEFVLEFEEGQNQQRK